MAIVTYPLDNLDFSAKDVAIYNSTRTTGIYAGDDFTATINGNDNIITIGVGLAWMRLSKFNGVAVAMQEQTAIDMGLPDTNYPRIDAVVLQFDANKNETEITVKNGTASSSPKAPEVIRTEALYELHLYQVRREPSSTAITAGKITDLRLNDTYCGIMADAVTQVDTTVINAQISALIEQLRESLEEVEEETYFASKDYVDAKHLTATATLSSSGWSNGYQTVGVSGVTADNSVFVSVPESSYEAYTDSEIRCVEQSAGSLKFKCESAPSDDITVDILIIN